MPTKPLFTHKVTQVPADWANLVSDLVFDVFQQARSLTEAKQVLGIGTLGAQAANNVSIAGGTLNNVDIGLVQPGLAKFVSVEVSVLAATLPGHLTTKAYVDQAIVNAFNQLAWRDMAQQGSNNVNITGGSATFDVLRSRAAPVAPYDVVTLGYLTANGAGMAQADAPMTIAGDNRTVTTTFPALAGRCAIFVDGIYQLPDQYSITGPHEIRFADPLPVGSIVGGFRV